MVRRYFRWISMALAAAAMALAVVPAQAQLFCGKREDMVARLGETFREQRIGYGLGGSMMIVEVFASARGTWTMLMTDVNGQSCIVAAGEGWEIEVAQFEQGT
jgi:hypothetical protein